MASSNSWCFFFALVVAVSLSNVELVTAARQLLQLPNLPTLPPLPSIIPTLPGLPPLPSAGNIPIIPRIQPIPTLPGLTPLPSAGIIPTIPRIPSIPKIALPPLPSNLPTIPITIPGLTPAAAPGGNSIVQFYRTV